MAHDLFIHHFGSRTFAGNGVDAESLLEENERRFAAKWGLQNGQRQRVALRPFVRNGTHAANGETPPIPARSASEGSGSLGIDSQMAPPNGTNSLDPRWRFGLVCASAPDDEPASAAGARVERRASRTAFPRGAWERDPAITRQRLCPCEPHHDRAQRGTQPLALPRIGSRAL